MANGPIQRLGKAFSFQRYLPPERAKGQLQTPQADTSQAWTMKAAVEPLKPFEAANLPEGYRNTASVRIYTETLLNVADEKKGKLGDRFIYRGDEYEVKLRADWEDYKLPHFKFIAFKVENS